jgi:hypothetical protein
MLEKIAIVCILLSMSLLKMTVSKVLVTGKLPAYFAELKDAPKDEIRYGYEYNLNCTM